MNLLAFLFLIGCSTLVALALIFHDEASDLFSALAERMRNPRPTMLEELHRHWEAEDGIDRR